MQEEPQEGQRDGWLRLGVAAELSKRYAEDQRDFFKTLALLLESALPAATSVEKRGGIFAKKTPHRIIIALGTNRYTLADPGQGPLLATRTRIVRGIALKTDDLPVEEWIAELSAQLDEQASTSQSAREALSRLVE